MPDPATNPATPPSPPPRPGGFRHVTLRGLAVLLPSILTLWILWYAFVFVFNNVAEPINSGLRAGIIRLAPIMVPASKLPSWYTVSPAEVEQYKASNASKSGVLSSEAALTEIRQAGLERTWRAKWYLQATGLLVGIALIYLAGTLVGGFLGRRVYAYLERVISKVPGFKQVYPYVKQLVELVLGEKTMAFSRVVLVECPRPGSWVMGFVTAGGLKTAGEILDGDAITVFIPNTPTPFTGFTLTVRADAVIDLPISIDEALRYIITGGVLMPNSQQIAAPGEPAVPGRAPTADTTQSPAAKA